MQIVLVKDAFKLYRNILAWFTPIDTKTPLHFLVRELKASKRVAFKQPSRLLPADFTLTVYAWLGPSAKHAEWNRAESVTWEEDQKIWVSNIHFAHSIYLWEKDLNKKLSQILLLNFKFLFLAEVQQIWMVYIALSDTM